MPTQDYKTHTQYVPLFHFVLIPVLVLTLIGSIVNLIQSLDDHQRLYSAALIVVLTTCMTILSLLARIFALKAQDRAIRAEQNLRHYVLTGKLLDPGLTVGQIVALRFAPDPEFIPLAQRAAKDGLSSNAIKQAIQNS